MNDITQLNEINYIPETEEIQENITSEEPSPTNSDENEIIISGAKHKTPIRMLAAFTAGIIFSICLFSAIICGSLAADKISSAHKTLTDFLLGQIYPAGYMISEETKGIKKAETDINLNSINISPKPESPSTSKGNINDGNTNENVYNIIKTDLTPSEIMSISNETKYTVDAELLSNKNINLPLISQITSEYGESSPMVLIVHTHGSESYDIGKGSFRTDDPSLSVIAVGDVIAKTLNDFGITSVHCREAFDSESYIDSYRRCAEAVVSYLEEYPSIKYVFDVHRDAIIKADNTVIAPTTNADGKSFAQYMIVSGSNQGGADFPDWEDNLSFAAKIQKLSSGIFPSAARNLNLRTASFNQQLASRSLLLEVGSAGNSLEEAKRTGAYISLLIANMLGAENLPENYVSYCAELEF